MSDADEKVNIKIKKPKSKIKKSFRRKNLTSDEDASDEDDIKMMYVYF